MPAFNGPLNHSNPLEKLLELAAHQVRGIGIFEDVAEREDLPEALRSSPYIAYMCNDDKIYVYDGPRQSVVGLDDKLQFVDDADWEDSTNWTEIGGTGLTNELNDLTAAVTWADVPDTNITETSVTQHEAALTIGQSQVTDLSNDLTAIQGDVSQNDTDITTLQAADTTLQNNINAVNTTISGLDTDDITEGGNLYYTTARFDSDLGNKDTDDLTQGSTNLYNVKSDWNASTGASSEILNKPPTFPPSAHNHAISEVTGLQGALNAKVDDSQVQTDVPLNAVFTDTTYSVQDGELSQNNFTNTLKTKLDGIASGAEVNAVDSVNTQTGAVVLDTDDIAEGTTNEYFTDAKVAANSAVAANIASISNIVNDVTAAEDDIDDLETELSATQTGAGLDADGNYVANGAANYIASSTSLTGADDALDAQIKANFDNIASNTTHRNLTSSNPHGTSLGQVSNVSTSGGSTNDVLAQNSSGSFDLKNPFDLFMSAAETLGDFPTSGSALGDLDGDGNVGVPDLLLFLANFNSSIFDLSSQSITFTSMSSTPVSIDTSSLNESNYDNQTALSNLTKLNIGAQTSDNSISPYDWIVNQTNDYIQFYTTDGSDISGSSGFTYFDNAKVQIANPTNLQVSVVAVDPDTVFALYCYIETIYSSSTESQLELVGTYSAPAITNNISVNQDAENPIVIDHPLFAVNSSGTEYPEAARIYFYVGIPEIFEYDTFTCSISDLKINITQ